MFLCVYAIIDRLKRSVMYCVSYFPPLLLKEVAVDDFVDDVGHCGVLIFNMCPISRLPRLLERCSSVCVFVVSCFFFDTQYDPTILMGT